MPNCQAVSIIIKGIPPARHLSTLTDNKETDKADDDGLSKRRPVRRQRDGTELVSLGHDAVGGAV